jgi:cyclase
MKAYLNYVRSESQRFFAQGLTVLEAAKRIDLGPYAGWTEPTRIVFNVERAYRELRGEPFDSPIDALALFRGMYELEEAPGFGLRATGKTS